MMGMLRIRPAAARCLHARRIMVVRVVMRVVVHHSGGRGSGRVRRRKRIWRQLSIVRSRRSGRRGRSMAVGVLVQVLRSGRRLSACFSNSSRIGFDPLAQRSPCILRECFRRGVQWRVLLQRLVLLRWRLPLLRHRSSVARACRCSTLSRNRFAEEFS
jgi:hypothetical protein